MIGEFEYLILSAAAHLGEEAYGAAMREVIETTGGRTCSLGALYTTLDRLEAKGLVETWMSAPTQQRGGRAKRMVRVTGEGASMMKMTGTGEVFLADLAQDVHLLALENEKITVTRPTCSRSTPTSTGTSSASRAPAARWAAACSTRR